MATSTPPSGPSGRRALEEMGESCLDVAGARRLVRRLAEVDEMLLAAQWAAVMASRATIATR